MLVAPEPAALAVPMSPPKVTAPSVVLGLTPEATAFKSIVANAVDPPISPVISIVPVPALISRSSLVEFAFTVPSIVTFAPPPVFVSIVISPKIVVLPVMLITPSEAVVISPFIVVGPVIVISSIFESIAATVTAPVPPSRLVMSVTVPAVLPVP